MNIEDKTAEAVSELVDRLVATAKAELGPGTDVTRDGAAVVLEGPRLALRRIADVRLRDLCDTAVKRR